MTTITPAYIEQNRALHDTGVYGVSAPEYLAPIRLAAKLNDVKTILDYGSGQHEWIKWALGEKYAVRSYDPCIAGLDAPPEPAEFVVSLDVLEHVEPECLSAVLADIDRLTQRLLFLSIATGPARKTLPDGRNAHLIQEDERFWFPLLIERFRLERFQRETGNLLCMFSRRAD